MDATAVDPVPTPATTPAIAAAPTTIAVVTLGVAVDRAVVVPAAGRRSKSARRMLLIVGIFRIEVDGRSLVIENAMAHHPPQEFRAKVIAVQGTKSPIGIRPP